MSDRDEKWVAMGSPFEPGKGQPYRIEFPNGVALENYHPGSEMMGWMQRNGEPTYLVDSSWKPPLDLPTTPTWGIAVPGDACGASLPIGDRWRVVDDAFIGDVCSWRVSSVVEFIPLTPEQVARIEGAR